MADVTLTVVDLLDAGSDITTGLQALVAADTYYYANSDGLPIVYLISTGSVTVTIETPFTGQGEAMDDFALVMVNTDAVILAPRVGKFFNQTDGTGRVKITVSGAGVSAGVYRP